MSGISLLIPTYNRASYLRQTLQSLGELEIPPGIEVEILVINNNCRDNTSEVVAQARSSHRIVVREVIETQQGLCFGRNRGLAEARYENLAYLDDDILVSPSWVASYFEAQQTYGVDAVVGPVFPIFEHGQPDFIHGRALDIISSGYSRKGDVPRLLSNDLAHELPGCNFGVTRAMAQRLGGFNPQLDRIGKGLLAGGDFDLGLRLVAAGGQTAYHPGCGIKHVMVQEKLSKAYLRRRAFGLGATARRMNVHPVTGRVRFRKLLSACKLWLTVLWSYVTRHPEAFNRELLARKASGQLWG